MKKRIITALLCTAIALGMAGCSESESPADDSAESSGGTSESLPESRTDESTPSTPSMLESRPETNTETSSEESLPSSTESVIDEQPEQEIDWSKVPTVDASDLEYEIHDENLVKTKGIFFGENVQREQDANRVYANGFVFITGYTGNAEYINLPDEIEGKQCILISEKVNWGDNAKALRFSESISIFMGGNTGSAQNVTQLVLEHESLDCIPSYIGSSFPALKSITIPEWFWSIPRNTFTGCKNLERVNFPERVTGDFMIGDDAFSGCTSLKSIELPEGVVAIGRNAFRGCEFKSITLPDSVEHIGDLGYWGEINYKGKTYNEFNIDELEIYDMSFNTTDLGH